MDRGEAMSRFKGLEDTLTPKEREHYEPGEHNYEAELAGSIAEQYFNTTMSDITTVMDLGDDLDSQLPDTYEESFNPNVLLDALIARIALGGQADYQYGLNLILVPLIRKYYDLGYNGFVVNLSPLETGPHQMLDRFVGEEDRPLELTWKSNNRMSEFAWMARHCNLTFHGTAEYMGYYVKNVTIDMRGEANTVGTCAEDSTFYIPSLFQIGVYSNIEAYSTRCDFHITLPILEHHPFEEVANKDFYERKNRILVPDSSGGWEELKPESSGED